MTDSDAVDAIVAIVCERTGLDFSRYREATILRRIRNRMLSVRLQTLQAYLEWLQAEPSEATQLAERITIKVSRFYRNAATFDAIRARILPALARKRGAAPLELWSAGCGCGEEAYTLAMLLDRLGIPGTVDATDIDLSALSHAAAGLYPVDALSELPGDLRDGCLEPVIGAPRATYRVAARLRARVRFRRHDLISGQAAPGARLYDMVACRNVLIYFQPAAQELALQTILAAVMDDGVVCLGEAEWPTASFTGRLSPIDVRKRLFRNLPPGEKGVES